MQPKQTPCHEAHGFDIVACSLNAVDERLVMIDGSVAMGGDGADAIGIVEDAGHLTVGETCFATVLHDDVQ